jgi:astacin (peptidase family M12A)
MSRLFKTCGPITFESILLFALCVFCVTPASAQTDQIPDVPEGYVVIDGDEVFPVSLLNSAYQLNTWPDGLVPFEFDANVTAANQTNMLNAMAVLQGVANVNFQQCAQNVCIGPNYVHIQNSTVNNSLVGMSGPGAVINITSWNFQFIIVHELMHCLGILHEHQRPDRDTYLLINNNNVSGTLCQGGCLGQFTLQNGTGVSRSLTYDFGSVMHYGQCAFSINPNCPVVSGAFPDGGITIAVKAPFTATWQGAIGQRTQLSALDQAIVSFLYPQPHWLFLDCFYTGINGFSNGTFSRPYTDFATAENNTPPGGTIWILSNCSFQAIGIHNKQITVRTAPGVSAILGD